MACSCKKRCVSGDHGFSKDTFLNDAGYGPQQAAEIAAENLKKQKEADRKRAEFYKTLTDIGVVVAVLVGSGLAVYLLVKINRG